MVEFQPFFLVIIGNRVKYIHFSFKNQYNVLTNG